MKKTTPQTNTNSTPRPPVVAILGHIDHGKSTLLDYIRKSNVVGKEAGGITQHASAYEIERDHDGKKERITFIDTPGHEAFNSMRTRCANVADIAVLIVSSEDGVKPQTLEVIKYIKECSLPFIVAITKIDKPSADIEGAKQSLAENNIYVEGYGGDTPVVEVSGKTGQGLDDLLDMIGLMSELEEKKSDQEALGSGVIIESHMDAKRGITAVGIIKDGTVRKSLFAAVKGSGGTSGATCPIRFLLDADGKTVDELSFSSPVQIVGWDKMPSVGVEFMTFKTKDEALSYSSETEGTSKESMSQSTPAENDKATLPLVIKADTLGSLEVIESELEKLEKETIMPKVILTSVGIVNENDVKSALTTPGSVIVSFNTKTDSQAASLAERSGVEIFSFSIIYELMDKINSLLEERTPKLEVEEVTGSAKVLKLFNTTRGKQVIGARVVSGEIKQGSSIKIMRREKELGKGKVKELQQAKVAATSVKEGSEFGAMIESKIDITPGDMLEASTLVTK